MRKSRPRPSEDKINREHPLFTLRQLADLLRREWEWERKKGREERREEGDSGEGMDEEEIAGE